MSSRFSAGKPHGHAGAAPDTPLEGRVRQAQHDPDGMAAGDFLGVIGEIIPELRSNITSKYLKDKIQKIQDMQDQAEQKRMCKSLTPYLDWYLQGL